MSIINYWDPFGFDRLFDEAFDNRFFRRHRGPHPVWTQASHLVLMDVHEDENNLVTASFELPGLKKEDINFELQGHQLTISGETRHEKERQEGGWVLRERGYGSFFRAISMPPGIKPENIIASMENGVLRVSFPKVAEEQLPKKITVG